MRVMPKDKDRTAACAGCLDKLIPHSQHGYISHGKEI